MKCTTCGAETEPGAAFCNNCGTRTPAPVSSAGQQTVMLVDVPITYADNPEASVASPVDLASPPILHVPAPAPVPTTGSYAAMAAVPTNTLAIVSLVCGVLGIVQILPLIGPIIAVVAGHIARRQIQDANGATVGSGLALAGMICGYLMFVLYALLCVLLVVIFGLAGMSLNGTR